MKKIVILFILIGTFSFSQKIYIGDLVHLNIEGDNITRQQLEEKFKKFDIEKIVKKDKGYNISIRSFETGKHNISIGNTTLEIIVESAMDKENNQKRDKIFEVSEDGKIKLEILSKPFPITYLLIFFAIIIFFFIVFIIFKFFKQRKINRRSAYEIFIKDIKTIDSDEYFLEMTKIFKEYIYNRYKIKISGKTSKEILKEIPEEIDKEKLKTWLDFADLCKFSGLEPTLEEKELYKNMLVKIIEKSEQEIFEVK